VVAAKTEDVMTKLTVQFTGEMDEVLGELAEARGLPKTQVLRRAVLLMRYLDEAAAAGADLVLRDRVTGDEQKLVLESSMQRLESGMQR
jgi:predicted transcriptional regulator